MKSLFNFTTETVAAGSRHALAPDTKSAEPPRSPAPSLKLHFLGEGLYLWTCPNCPWQLEATSDEPIEHRCGVTQVVRLGDRIEAAFGKIGVTKEKYRGWKEVLGLPPACRCKERKEWLNRLDEKVGLGEKVAEFKNLMGW
jgi:hypothetical protein